MRKLTCSVCGTEFETNSGNVKYCNPECKEEGKRQRRKEWEDKTDYKEKQRQTMQIYRGKNTEEERQIVLEVKKQRAIKRQQEDAKRISEQQAELKEKAAQGDALARMRIAEVNSKEYWEAYKQYAIEYSTSWGVRSTGTVNDVSVYDPNFARKVVQSIEELGIIKTRF